MPTPICYTFASPRVGNDIFAAEFNKVFAQKMSALGTTCSARFFRTKDIVPTIPKSATYTHVENSYEPLGKDSSGAGGGILPGGKPHGMAKYRELLQGSPAT
jgi:Lipase (class 3)